MEKDQEITVNAFNPSLMAGTGLGRDYSLPMRFVWNVVLPALGFLGVKISGVKLNNLDDSSKAISTARDRFAVSKESRANILTSGKIFLLRKNLTTGRKLLIYRKRVWNW